MPPPAWVGVISFFSSHQQSVSQSTTFRSGCPSHVQAWNRKRNCHFLSTGSGCNGYPASTQSETSTVFTSRRGMQYSHGGEACSTSANRPSGLVLPALQHSGCHWALSATAHIEIEHRRGHVRNDSTLQKPPHIHRRKEGDKVIDGRGTCVFSRRGSLEGGLTVFYADGGD